MSYEQLKSIFRTLRFRLLAWNTLIVLLMVIPTLAGVREALRHALLSEFDQVLREDTLEVSLGIKRYYPDMQQFRQEMERKSLGHAHHEWFVQVYDDQGQLLWASPSTPNIELPPPVMEPTIPRNVGSYRMVKSVIQQPGIPPLIVRVGSALNSVQDDVDLLTRMVILAGTFILLLAPLGGYWLSGRATQPLARIIQTAARLNPSNLAERLPLRGTGDELDQLSHTINNMLDRIADYLGQKRDFIANAAHELRSPLAAIQSSVEVALNNDRSTEEYVVLLNDIMEECAGLGVVVNQLLLLAEGDAGQLAVMGKSTRLDAIAQKTLQMFQGAAEAEGIELCAYHLAPLQVSGDEHYLRQVVNNLVDNALKFTAPQGRVALEVRADTDQRQAVLCVSDTGAGIAAADLPHIFERFYQADKSRRRATKQRGNGLGLSICQAIVASLQGTIDVKSTPGQGSTFTIRLPLHH